MDFNLTQEQALLRESARRFVEDHYSLAARREAARSALGFSEDNWRSFGELGWLALGLPEDVGGFGFSFIETAILMEEFGRALVSDPYVSSAVLCAHILNRCANRDMRMRILPRMARGECRLALAHFESAQRYDRKITTTRAVRDGQGFVLNGEKTLVLDAPSAHHLVVSAYLEDRHAYSLFLVERGVPGLEMTSYPLIDVSRAADIRLERVRLPGAALLQADDGAAALLEEAIDRATLGRSAEAVGAMEAVMQATSLHLKNRMQFGQPLAAFQALRHRMAEMFVEVEEARSILYCGLAHVDAEPERRAKVIAAVKVVTARSGRTVGGLGIQLHGGMGLTAECAVSHYFKKLLAYEMIHGDIDENLDRLAANPLDI